MLLHVGVFFFHRSSTQMGLLCPPPLRLHESSSGSVGERTRLRQHKPANSLLQIPPIPLHSRLIPGLIIPTLAVTSWTAKRPLTARKEPRASLLCVEQTHRIHHGALGRPLWISPVFEEVWYAFIYSFGVTMEKPDAFFPPPSLPLFFISLQTWIFTFHILELWSVLCGAHHHSSHSTQPAATVIIINQNTGQSIKTRQRPNILFF